MAGNQNKGRDSLSLRPVGVNPAPMIDKAPTKTPLSVTFGPLGDASGPSTADTTAGVAQMVRTLSISAGVMRQKDKGKVLAGPEVIGTSAGGN
ncbi:uncharacterized protein J3R85_013567 [Psidium guajava]|nr:uncharacterized protein J3R85_013567 [Psidium guajava]